MCETRVRRGRDTLKSWGDGKRHQLPSETLPVTNTETIAWTEKKKAGEGREGDQKRRTKERKKKENREEKERRKPSAPETKNEAAPTIGRDLTEPQTERPHSNAREGKERTQRDKRAQTSQTVKRSKTPSRAQSSMRDPSAVTDRLRAESAKRSA